MRSRIATLLAVATLILTACGGDDGTGGNGPDDIDSPCDLATAAMVEESFTGTSSEGVEGQARNCTFQIESGINDSVDVYYFGADSSWEGTRSGFEDNRGGTTDIPDLGDEAFYPNDAGPTEVVVRAGGHIFAVSSFVLFGEPGDTDVIAAAVNDLAHSIADSLG
jgi:hypothetical protein